jgi:hypothetical protein
LVLLPGLKGGQTVTPLPRQRYLVFGRTRSGTNAGIVAGSIALLLGLPDNQSMHLKRIHLCQPMAARSYIASVQRKGPTTGSHKHLFIKVSCEKHLGSHKKGIDDVVTAVFESYNKPAPREKLVRTEITQFKALDLRGWNLGKWHVLPCGCKGVFAADSISL